MSFIYQSNYWIFMSSRLRVGLILILQLFLLYGCSSGGGSSAEPPPDTEFISGSGFDDGVLAIEASSSGNGDVYVGGLFTDYQGTSSNRIIRLNSNGSIDAGFSVGSGFNEGVYDIAVATDGSGDIYVAGDFTAFNGASVNRIARLNSNGSLDSGFDPGIGFNDRANRIVLADDGSGDIYAGGMFTEYRGGARNRLARINDNGSLDLAFDVGIGFDSDVNVIALADDASRDIYVGGAFNTYQGNVRNRIVRLNADGSVDANFVIGAGFNSDVNDIVLAMDGSDDIYVGGFFTVYDGITMHRIARLNDNGSLDPAFDIGIGFDLFVQAIAPTNGGDIYVGGGFNNYDGNSAIRIARISELGEYDSAFATGSGHESTVMTLENTPDGIFIGGFFEVYNQLIVGGIVRVGADGRYN